MNLGWIVFFEAALINVFLAALVIAYPSIGWPGFAGGLIALIVVSGLLIKVAKGATQKPDAQAV